jgi:hypothetical protein
MKFNSLAPAALAGLLGLAAAAAAVAAPPWSGSYDRIPDGSYQRSCRDISAFNGQLYARCQASGGGFYDTQISYRSCSRGIANVDGRLQCEGAGDGYDGGYGGGYGSGGGWSGGGSGPVGLIVYENPNYKGMKLEISDSVPDLAGSGLDDQITSVRVLRGSWLLCSARDFNGDCRTFDADNPNINSLNLNDRVSSIRRLRR